LGFARGGKYEVKPSDLNPLIEKSAGIFGRTKKEIRIHKKYFRRRIVVKEWGEDAAKKTLDASRL
jgi:hypothetical protein